MSLFQNVFQNVRAQSRVRFSHFSSRRRTGEEGKTITIVTSGRTARLEPTVQVYYYK